MCFIATGHFNKPEKKSKKSYTPITANELSFFNEVLKKSGLIDTFKMINECANSPSFSNRMLENEIKNTRF